MSAPSEDSPPIRPRSPIIAPAIYRLAGLRIASDFPLIGVQLCHDAVAKVDVVIRRASISEELAAASALYRDGRFTRGYNLRAVLLDFPGVGRFLVRAGTEILIDPASSCEEGEIRAYLLGTAFGLLCHQRGIMPLHASAIDVDNQIIAFVGPSGAGKSTLAAALARRGYEVIADDVCFLQLDSEGIVQAWPGVARIRLWEEAMNALGCSGPGVEREMHGYNKYFIPVRPPRNPMDRRRLRRIYLLEAAPDGAAKITRLHGAAAVEVLMQNTYRLCLAQHMGYMSQVFALCAAGARDVPVFRFSRPVGFDRMNQGIDLLESHIGDRN
jgi:hypothetical protein